MRSLKKRTVDAKLPKVDKRDIEGNELCVETLDMQCAAARKILVPIGHEWVETETRTLSKIRNSMLKI